MEKILQSTSSEANLGICRPVSQRIYVLSLTPTCPQTNSSVHCLARRADRNMPRVSFFNIMFPLISKPDCSMSSKPLKQTLDRTPHAKSSNQYCGFPTHFTKENASIPPRIFVTAVITDLPMRTNLLFLVTGSPNSQARSKQLRIVRLQGIHHCICV